MGRSRTTKLIWVVVAAVITLLIIAAAPMLSFFLGRPPKPLAFDSASWKRDTSIAMFSTRSRMANDLVSNHHLVGRPWAEVEELLGPPDADPYIAPYCPPGAKIYRLGVTFVDSLWLMVQVAENGTVAEAKVFED